MSVNKLTIRKDGFVDRQLTIPVQFTWDYVGLDQSIDEYEQDIITQVIGVGRDFEVTRFAHAPLTGITNPTDIIIIHNINLPKSTIFHPVNNN